MMRLLAVLVCLIGFLVAPGVRAQEPQITVTAEQEEVIIGQPYILRVEVLVPTFMPRAPVFPTFEMPDLIVRLPERSTVPISKRIEGQTWAGVQRTYRIYPMRAGVTDIPAQQLSIVYKDIETNEDVPLTVEVPATQIVATVPSGARTLDPLIVAHGLSIDQDWQVADAELAVGDAVVRQLEISVTGASALFVPSLLEGAAPQTADQEPADDEPAVAGFLSYYEDPRVTETMERGVMSGTRSEMVSYIAQSGGTASFPQVTLSWYNLDTDEVEEIVLDGRMVTVAMPPRVRTAADRQKARRGILLLVLLVALVWAAHRWLWPIMRPSFDRIRATYDGSTYAAQRLAERRAAAKDLGGLMQALELRTTRGHPPSRGLLDALQVLTRAVYRNGKTATEAARQWQDVRQRLRQDRPRLRDAGRSPDASGLAPLNPFS
jgi:hypothetical protein